MRLTYCYSARDYLLMPNSSQEQPFMDATKCWHIVIGYNTAQLVLATL